MMPAIYPHILGPDSLFPETLSYNSKSQTIQQTRHFWGCHDWCFWGWLSGCEVGAHFDCKHANRGTKGSSIWVPLENRKATLPWETKMLLNTGHSSLPLWIALHLSSLSSHIKVMTTKSGLVSRAFCKASFCCIHSTCAAALLQVPTWLREPCLSPTENWKLAAVAVSWASAKAALRNAFALHFFQPPDPFGCFRLWPGRGISSSILTASRLFLVAIWRCVSSFRGRRFLFRALALCKADLSLSAPVALPAKRNARSSPSIAFPQSAAATMTKPTSWCTILESEIWTFGP